MGVWSEGLYLKSFIAFLSGRRAVDTSTMSTTDEKLNLFPLWNGAEGYELLFALVIWELTS